MTKQQHIFLKTFTMSDSGLPALANSYVPVTLPPLPTLANSSIPVVRSSVNITPLPALANGSIPVVRSSVNITPLPEFGRISRPLCRRLPAAFRVFPTDCFEASGCE